jgi:hypothetical protein
VLDTSALELSALVCTVRYSKYGVDIDSTVFGLSDTEGKFFYVPNPVSDNSFVGGYWWDVDGGPQMTVKLKVLSIPGALRYGGGIASTVLLSNKETLVAVKEALPMPTLLFALEPGFTLPKEGSTLEAKTGTLLGSGRVVGNLVGAVGNLGFDYPTDFLDLSSYLSILQGDSQTTLTEQATVLIGGSLATTTHVVVGAP